MVEVTSPPQSEAPPWTIDLVPYYWAASLGGSLAIDGQTVDLEGGGDGFFGDPALSGFLGHFEAHRGPWSLVVAPIFISADMQGAQPPTTDADLTVQAEIHELFVAREFSDGWEWMLGLRYQKLETDMDLSVAGVPLSSHASERAWTDPIVGLRYHAHLSEDWTVHARADVGGFGVGSDFVWNASVLTSYQCTRLFGLQLGYRALSLDFEDLGAGGRLAYDLDLYGPILGASFSF